MSLSDTIETDIDKVEAVDKNVVIYLPDPPGDRSFKINSKNIKIFFQEIEIISASLLADVNLCGATSTFISQSVG